MQQKRNCTLILVMLLAHRTFSNIEYSDNTPLIIATHHHLTGCQLQVVTLYPVYGNLNSYQPSPLVVTGQTFEPMQILG